MENSMSDPNDLSHEANSKPQEGQIGTRHQKEIRRLLENMRRARSEARGGDTELPATGAAVGQAGEQGGAGGGVSQPYASESFDDSGSSRTALSQPEPVYSPAEPAYYQEEQAPSSFEARGPSYEADQMYGPEAMEQEASLPPASLASHTVGQPVADFPARETPQVAQTPDFAPASVEPVFSPSTGDKEPPQDQRPRVVAAQKSRQPVQQEPPVSRGNFFSAAAAQNSPQPQPGPGRSQQLPRDASTGGPFAQQTAAGRPVRRSTAKVTAQPATPDVSSVARQVKPVEAKPVSRFEQSQGKPPLRPEAGPALPETPASEAAGQGPFSQRAGVRPANNFQTKSDVLLNRGTAARREQPEEPQAALDDNAGSREAKPSFGRASQPKPTAKGPAFGPRDSNDKAKRNMSGRLWEPPAEVASVHEQAPEKRVPSQPAQTPRNGEAPAETVQADAAANQTRQFAAAGPVQAAPLEPREHQPVPAFSRQNSLGEAQEPEQQPLQQKKPQPDRPARPIPTQNRQAFAQQAGSDMRQEDQGTQRQAPQREVEVLHGDIQWGNRGGSTFEEKSAQFAEAYRAARKKVLSNVPPPQPEAVVDPAAQQHNIPQPQSVPQQEDTAPSQVDSESVNAMYEALAKYRASLNRTSGPAGADADAHPEAQRGVERQAVYQQEAYAPVEPQVHSPQEHTQTQPAAFHQPQEAAAGQREYAEYYQQNEPVQQPAQRAPEQAAARNVQPPRESQQEFAHPGAAPQQNYVYVTDNVEEPVTPPAGTDTLARPQIEEQHAHMYAQPQETQAPAYGGQQAAAEEYYNAPGQRGMHQEQPAEQPAHPLQQQTYIQEQHPHPSPAEEREMRSFSQVPPAQQPEPAAEPERQPEPVDLQPQQAPVQYQPQPAAAVPQSIAQSQSVQENTQEDDKKSWKAGKLLSKIAKPSDSFGSPAESFPVSQAPVGGMPGAVPASASGYPGGSWVWQPGSEGPRSSWFRRHPFLSVFLLILLIALGYGAGRYMSDSTPSGPKIAIINVEGMILDSAKVVEWADQVRKDDSYKGAILRINSPGGAVGPSQEIFAAIKRLDQIKPVVASMGGVAASGGYYAALGAREIYSGPSTLTAGIGVKMQIPNVNGLMQTVGISEKTLSTGNLKDAGSAWRTMSPEEESYFYELLNDMYVEFMQTVSEQRKISMEDVQVLADGGAMTGRQALGAKLVDQLGDQHDAVERLKVLCNMKPGDSFSLVEGPQVPANKLKDFFLSLFQAGMEHKAAAEQPRFFY